MALACFWPCLSRHESFLIYSCFLLQSVMTDAYEGQGGFEWDPDKAKSNIGKHRVTFEEAMSAFRDPFSLTVPDPNHSELEDRLILMGLSDRQRLLVVVYVERDDALRLISARAADPDEKREYEEEPGYGF